MTSWMYLFDTLVRARTHQGPHAYPGVCPRGIDVDNVLHHRMVQQKAVDGAVAPLDEEVLEAALVESFDALLATVTAT